MKNALLGFVAGAVVVLAAAFLFLTQGGMPVATRGGPLPLEEFMAGRALRAAIGQDARRPAPIPPDLPHLLAGAKVYGAQCAMCHGVLDEPERTPVARGMFPRPPRLLPPGEGVTDDPVGATYWKVRNGIRLTGMPAFEGALTDQELWEVSLLLREAGQLPAPVKQALR